MKKALSIGIVSLALLFSFNVSAECNPMVRDHFKDSIQKLEALSKSEHYDLEYHLQSHIRDLVEKKEYALVDSLVSDFKEYKQQTIAKKEKILSSLRYALVKKLPVMDNHLSFAFADGGFSLAECALSLKVLGWIITGISIQDAITNDEPLSYLPAQELKEVYFSLDRFIVKLLKYSFALVGIGVINEIIFKIQDLYHEKFENLSTKIKFIDQLIQFADKQKVGAINS